MARWTLYGELEGYPVYADVEVDDEDMDQDEVYQMVLDNFAMTLEVTKED